MAHYNGGNSTQGGGKGSVGVHTTVIEVEDKWAVVSLSDCSRGIVTKGQIRRGNLQPVQTMRDFLRPGFTVVTSIRKAKYADSDAHRHYCNWVVTKISRQNGLILPPAPYYRDPSNFFDFQSDKKRKGLSVDILGSYTGEAVYYLRNCLKSWNGISLEAIMDNLYQGASREVLDGLDSVETLATFVQSLPRFFTLTSLGFLYSNSHPEVTCIEAEIQRRLPAFDVGIFGDRAIIISKPWEVANVVNMIIRERQLNVVAFDTERATKGSSEYLSTIQIALMGNDSQAYIFDVMNWSNKNFHTSKLKKLLESDSVIKVVHDCRGDSAVLETYDICLTNVFDTAVAYTTIMEQSNTVYAPPPNFSKLCQIFGRFTPQRNSKNVYQGNQNYWAYRPFTKNMIDHAASDVLGLATYVYENMRSFMNPSWKSRFDALCRKSLKH
ncbi:uncharacterized protein [Asterias amurensis]|uniref:uncharacterized protein n=1 Tax=Asterias amurensis TaxID=7602 RepID=UPI003AB7CADC